MRRARLRAFTDQSVAYCHCICRVGEQRFLLADQDKEQLVAWMRLYEEFWWSGYAEAVAGKRAHRSKRP